MEMYVVLYPSEVQIYNSINVINIIYIVILFLACFYLLTYYLKCEGGGKPVAMTRILIF